MAESDKQLRNIYSLHFDELNRYLSHRTGRSESSLDMTQDVFVRLMEKEERIDEVRHPRGYLYRTAKNLLTDRVRREQEPLLPLNEATINETADSPETIIQRRQLLSHLLEAIEALPPRCREVFVLHRFEGLSYPEIGRRLGIGVSAVEKQMMRAMRRCRDVVNAARVHP